MSALLTPNQMANTARRSKYAGLRKFSYSPKGTDLSLDCWLDYTRACPGSYEGGQQMEPDTEAIATLCIAEVGGEDLLEILSESTVKEIEEAYLCDLSSDERDYRYDRHRRGEWS